MGRGRCNAEGYRRPLYPGGRHWCLPRLGLLLQLRRRMWSWPKPALRVSGRSWNRDAFAAAVASDTGQDGGVVPVAESVGNGPKGRFAPVDTAEVIGFLPLVDEGPFPAGAG